MKKQSRSVVITGSSGAIGQALAKKFAANDYLVVGIDIQSQPQHCSCTKFILEDLGELITNDQQATKFYEKLLNTLESTNLHCLINNAAIQITKPSTELNTIDWIQSLNVNTIAPFLLIKTLLSQLEQAQGSVINISSIHATLTKSGFAAYATSKAALTGLTKSLAIEWGRKVRINAIAPAAIETPMLKEGFKANEKALKDLAVAHPIGRIGTTDEVANLALFLASDQAKFVNGSIFDLNGGIGGRLHDPL